ncbi:MAG: hypothetical protein ACT6SC_18580, partial [Blastomonas fulva]
VGIELDQHLGSPYLSGTLENGAMPFGIQRTHRRVVGAEFGDAPLSSGVGLVLQIFGVFCGIALLLEV